MIEGRVRLRLICEGSSVEDGVVGTAAGLLLGGDCVGVDNVSASGMISGGVVNTMFVVMTVTGLSDIVVLSSTSTCFVIVTDTVGVTIIELRELADSISARVVLPWDNELESGLDKEGVSGGVESELVFKWEIMDFRWLVAVEGDTDVPPVWNCEEVSGMDAPTRDVV